MTQLSRASQLHARIIGAGRYVPEVRMTTERITQLIPGWNAERVVDRTGIVERRYLWDIDDITGRAIRPPRDSREQPFSGVDMAEIALRNALCMADVAASRLDALFVVTCTPDEPSFCHDTMLLHRRLSCRPDCYALLIDSGCGGTMYVLDMVSKMIASGVLGTAAVVGSNFSSSMIDREVYKQSINLPGSDKSIDACLSAYVFGDGAGAIVLEADKERGILASTAGNEHLDLVIKPGGGALLPVYAPWTKTSDLAFVVNGGLVQKSYLDGMRRTITTVLEAENVSLGDVRRYFLHQPNQRLFDHFIHSLGLTPEQAPSHVSTRGNTSSAGMLILFSEALERGDIELGSGDLAVFSAIGAGAHHGGQLVRL